MALQKQVLNINFSLGVDQKTDPWQLKPGQFQAMENNVFAKGGLLTKRFGFPSLAPLPDDSYQTATSFLGDLIAVGNRLQLYSRDTREWYDKGFILPMSLEVSPIVRNQDSQICIDSATDENLSTCLAYLDSDGVAYYQVIDSQSGQTLLSKTAIGSTATLPRVFVLGNFFVITFLITDTTTHLKYIAIPVNDPLNPGSITDIADDVSSLSAGYDGIICNGSLYLAYDGDDVGGAIHITYLTAHFSQGINVDIPAYTGNLISLACDNTYSTPVIWLSFYDTSAQDAYTTAFNIQLDEVLAPTQTINNIVITKLTSAAINQSCTLFYQITNTYSFSPSNRTDNIGKVSITQAGVVGSPSVVLRSVGLFSKAFFLPGTETSYMLATYQGQYQPTYFLIDETGNVVMKMAYSNGNGYTVNQMLSSVTFVGSDCFLSYLLKTLLTPVNKMQGASFTDGVYAQVGCDLAKFSASTGEQGTFEIGNNLHIVGGFLWMYDGVKPVEHGFHLWPEDIGITSTTAAVTPTGDVTDTDTVITNVSSMVRVAVGCTITGTGIPGGTTIVAVSGNTITLSAAATATNSGVTLTITGSVAAGSHYYYVTYEWTDAQGNIHRSAPSIPLSVSPASASVTTLHIPYLRLTYKTSPNNLRIVIYRWGVNQQVPYQITSIIAPELNTTSSDSLTYYDALADDQIIGNQVLYTNGGVVENIAAPACSAGTLYKNRLVLIPCEEPNQLWYSKQVVQNVPVEMSDLFTLYVAPTVAGQESTGPNHAVAQLDDKLLISKSDLWCYVQGEGPDNTGAQNDFSDAITINATVGCQNPRSLTILPDGIAFQSRAKGIWSLKRDLSTFYLGAPVDDYNSSPVISSVNVTQANEVRFDLENNTTLVYDYYWGQWNTFKGIRAVSSTIVDESHTSISYAGSVLQQTDGSYVDGSQPVLLSFTTGWFNLAGLQGYQRAYSFYILAKYLTPHKLLVDIYYDYESGIAQSTLIEPINGSPAYGAAPYYGSGSPFGGSSRVEQWEVAFKRQKCQAFKLRIREISHEDAADTPGAGLSISGLALVLGMKKGYPVQRTGARTQVG